ncbi:hypothetical protein PFZ49_12620 [Microbacterium lacticum]|uniref:hypothetical protein n=1 Tax=Microbacterium lacticum TaxID=33885 RepID=UPI003A83A634
MNSNSNIDLQSNGIRKPRSRSPHAALIAATIGAALCIGLGASATAIGASANPVAKGHFKIASHDKDNHRGEYGGWSDDNTGSENPGGDGGENPGGGGNTGGENAVVALADPRVMTMPLCSASRLTVNWSIDTAVKGTPEIGQLIDGKVEAIPAKLTASTTGTVEKFRTELTGSGAVPAGQTVSYAVRFTDERGNSSRWAIVDATAPLIGALTCVSGRHV